MTWQKETRKRGGEEGRYRVLLLPPPFNYVLDFDNLREALLFLLRGPFAMGSRGRGGGDPSFLLNTSAMSSGV